MKTTLVTSCLVAASQALNIDLAPPHTDHAFSNPSTPANTGFRVPSSYESAVMGRRILALSKLGHLSTVFPSHSSSASEEDVGEQGWRRPSNVGGSPIGMMDYVADCESEDVGNPTILAISMATSFQNVRAGSNISLSMRWTPPYAPSKRISSASSSSSTSLLDSIRRVLFGGPEEDSDPQDGDAADTVPYSAANLPRFSLIGYLENIPEDAQDSGDDLAECFVHKHPDAKYWLPGNRIHHSEWNRLVVTAVYWVGGFGDRAYIGWIPLDEWNDVTRDEWEAIELPGESEGWKEWSARESWAGGDL